jgi:hypothetical protein
MREIEETQAAAGLTPALFAAMAEVYADLAALRDGRPPEEVDSLAPLDAVLDRLTRQAESEPSRD